MKFESTEKQEIFRAHARKVLPFLESLVRECIEQYIRFLQKQVCSVMTAMIQRYLKIANSVAAIQDQLDRTLGYEVDEKRKIQKGYSKSFEKRDPCVADPESFEVYWLQMLNFYGVEVKTLEEVAQYKVPKDAKDLHS